MIAGRKVLAIIPARGGSKGIPRKNLRPLLGKPLIAWSIEEAKRCPVIDRLVISSEDEEILSVAREWGCETPFVRPARLSQDHTPGIDPVLHAIEALPGYDLVVLLQPTSPLRLASDIEGCLTSLVSQGAATAVSVVEAHPSPQLMYALNSEGRLAGLDGNRVTRAIPRRQDIPQAYALNGALFAGESRTLLAEKSFITPNTWGYLMPMERSLDIDRIEDLELAEFWLSRRRGAV